jgi:hypothetical protein
MTRTLRGKIHGKTIELDEDLGVVDGQEVEVQVSIARPRKRAPGSPPGWRPGWRPGVPSKTAGSLAELDTEDEDRILDEIYQDRKRLDRRDSAE